MLVKTGLLVISNPNHISKALNQVRKNVQNKLYVQLMSSSLEHLSSLKYTWPSYSNAIRNIYMQAAKDCGNLDVRVLLSGIKYTNAKHIKTQNAIDLVVFDRKHDQVDIDRFIKENLVNISKNYNVLTVPTECEDRFAMETQKGDHFQHTCLGGTFDRIHMAHKLLLNEAALHSASKVTIGVTEENMLAKKTLWELAEPLEIRLKNVEMFLRDICPELTINVVPISDPLGPTKSDPTMDLLVVSAETVKGGEKVNEVRKSNGLPEMKVLAVELIDEPNPEANEETKISSSTTRMRLLGRLLKPVTSSLPSRPYIIGLTGGIASGKSGVSKRLEELGALVINCDQVAHQMYLPGTECYKQFVAEFGPSIVSAEGSEINRKQLGAIVFNDKEQLEKLNRLVWPMIANNLREQIRNSNVDVIVIEAAILLSAGWQSFCHEVWATLVPPEEAVLRLRNRNNLSEDQALSRIQSQANNKYYVNNAHVVLCSLWSVEFTRTQVDRAWKCLMERLKCGKNERQKSDESRSSSL